MSFSLEGKTAIVTGATRNIGQAIGLHFADIGANVMFADRDEKALEDMLPSDASNMQFFAGDLNKKLTRSNLISATIDAFESIDILVNADFIYATCDVMDAQCKSLDELIERNVTTPYRLSKMVARRMIKQVEGLDEDDRPRTVGKILNLSSILSQRTLANLSSFSISMAALDQMTRSLAVAFADDGVRINGLSMASVMTSGLAKRLGSDQDNRDEIVKNTPLGRLAEVSEIVETAQFLVSDASSFMTGHIATLDGGRNLLDTTSAAAL